MAEPSCTFSIIPFLGLLSLFLTFIQFTPSTANAIPSTTRISIIRPISVHAPKFREAPAFRNGETCGGTTAEKNIPPERIIHVAMTLDSNYLRGTMAAVFSMLQHSTCPENVAFHFLWIKHQPEVLSIIDSTFPYLNYKVYIFDPTIIRGLISKSIRQALDQPLNYARIYLADLIPTDVKRVIYFDSDLVMVDDIMKLWEVDLEGKVVAAPEYCKANFTSYFTKAFWTNRNLTKTFQGRKPCYFNTGLMVMDIDKWRKGGYTKKVRDWMIIQKMDRIYHLGSLPPFLLVLAGNIKGIDHRWNQHGLGGDNIEGKCRNLHPGPISLLHWSGKGKPWLRLDSRKPCLVDHLWAPYDLYRSTRQFFKE